MVAPPTVHDTAIVADDVELGEGAVIGPWALLGVDGPPEALEPSVRAYCPRCHETFLDPEGDCSDCPGVPRRAVQAT